MSPQPTPTRNLHPVFLQVRRRNAVGAGSPGRAAAPPCTVTGWLIYRSGAAQTYRPTVLQKISNYQRKRRCRSETPTYRPTRKEK